MLKPTCLTITLLFCVQLIIANTYSKSTINCLEKDISLFDSKHATTVSFNNYIPSDSSLLNNLNHSSQQESGYFFKNRHHRYMAVSAGLGPSYGNGSIGTRIQGRIGGNVGFGFHAGLGVYFDDEYYCYMVGLGVKFFPYRWFYLDFQMGTVGIYKNIWRSWSGVETNYQYMFGPSILWGGDLIFGKHWGFNFGYGFSYDLTEGQGLFMNMDLGLIFKF